MFLIRIVFLAALVSIVAGCAATGERTAASSGSTAAASSVAKQIGNVEEASHEPCQFEWYDYAVSLTLEKIKAPLPWFKCVKPPDSVPVERRKLLGVWHGTHTSDSGPYAGRPVEVLLAVWDVSGETPKVLLSRGSYLGKQPSHIYGMQPRFDEGADMVFEWTGKSGTRQYLYFTFDGVDTLKMKGFTVESTYYERYYFSGTYTRVVPFKAISAK